MVRNNLRYTACLLLILSATACKKNFLDQVPDDKINIDGVFQRKVETEKYLYNVYGFQVDEFNQYWDFSGSASAGAPWVGASDEADMVWPRADYATYAMNLGGWDATSGRYNMWRQYYKGIRSATYFMQRVDECKELTPALIKEYKAEARFLRALYYFYIIRQYGPVVLLDESKVIPPDATLPDLQIQRSSFDECVDYVVSELDKAAADLNPSVVPEATQAGRPTKGAALAVKARLLLYAASPLFNGNADYASMKNDDGKQLISQTLDANKWKKAADAAKTVIDMPQYSLYNQYSDPVKNYRYLFLDNWNSEVIYAKASTDDSWGYGYWEYHAAPRQAGGWNGIAPTQQLVDAYFMDNGLPINDPASGYVETGFSSADAGYTEAGTWNMYVNREPRFYASILYNGAQWINPSSGVGKVQLFSTGLSGKKGSHDHSETGYLAVKMIHPSSDVNQGLNVKHHYILFRLGEMYLNYAEALNESNPGNPDILTYVNKIRQRAGIPDLPVGLSQTEMRERIRAERRVELAFESQRYFDTRRWKIAEQTDGGDFWGMATDKGTSFTDASFYTRTVFEKRVFTKKHYLFPIPQSELNIDRKLVQNTGW